MNKNYWKKRFEQVEQRSHDFSVEYYHELEYKYREAAKEIEKQISTWLNRFAVNNDINPAEARKLLNSKELEELKWDVEQYINYGKKNNVDGRWIKQLENASAKFHINRLEALKIHLQQQIEILMGGMVDDMDDVFRNSYKESYYRSCYEIQKGVGVGFDVGQVSENKLSLVLEKPWSVDGKIFSERIWENKTKLINVIDQCISKMVMTGEAPAKTIKAVANAMNTSKSNATRLVMTEQAYFTSLAQKHTYKDLDVEEFEIVATLDGKTCPECGSYDGKHYPAKLMEAGINSPPFHPYCRCTTCPYFDDMEGYRASRNDEGKTVYEVPANMTYEEWKKVFTKDAISVNEKNEYKKYLGILKETTPTLENFIEIKYNKNKWECFKNYTSAIKSGELSPLADFKLYQSMSKQMDELLVGKTTSNGIVITSKSKHAIARVIGSVEQKRNGVNINDVLDALINSNSQISAIKTMVNGRSQKFVNSKVEVSLNPDTGNIIQVNPTHSAKKVKR